MITEWEKRGAVVLRAEVLHPLPADGELHTLKYGLESSLSFCYA